MKELFVILLVFLSSLLYAQKATYKIVYKLNADGVHVPKVKSHKAAEQAAYKVVLEMLDAQINMESVLLCNKYEASYFLWEHIVPEKQSIPYLMACGKFGCRVNDFYYSNIKTKEEIKYVERSGTKFRIVFPFKRFEWLISDESKDILGYTCFKATTSWTEYNPIKKMDIIHDITVWFTPDVPLPFGPIGYSGLPGLVLEAQRGKFFLYASEVKLLSEKKANKIKKPKKGKLVSKTEFTQLMFEAYKY